MGYMLRFRSNGDADDYKDAGKRAKQGIAMVMDGLEKGDSDMILAGAEKAWRGVRTMCDISQEMEDRYSDRHN